MTVAPGALPFGDDGDGAGTLGEVTGGVTVVSSSELRRLRFASPINIR